MFRISTVALSSTGSISPGITSVNVIYGVLTVKHFISDGIGKTIKLKDSPHLPIDFLANNL